MKKENKGKEPPEWMSTHPSSSRRIASLQKWIPEIIVKYPPIKNNGLLFDNKLIIYIYL